jgi:hypothetical protein
MLAGMLLLLFHEENFSKDPLKLWTRQSIAHKIREGKR